MQGRRAGIAARAPYQVDWRPGEGDRRVGHNQGASMNAPELPPAPSPGGPTPEKAATLEIFSTLSHYGAVDWARGHHDLCVINAAGAIVFELHIDDTPQGWADLRSRLATLKAPDGSAAVVGFAIETSGGPAVER